MIDVHVGVDGWLFLTGGTNSVVRYFTEADYFAGNIERWCKLLEQRLRRSEEAGILYRHAIVPDKLGLFAEKSGLVHVDPRLAPACALRDAVVAAGGTSCHRLLPVLVDLRTPLLLASRHGVQTYFKTDAHWTFEGCFVAYLALCANLGAVPRLSILDAHRLRGDLFLDLGSKLDPPVKEEYVTSLFFKDAVRVRVNDVVEYKETHELHDAGGLHAGSVVVFENRAAGVDPRTVVLFGDSYSEYRTHLLTGMLAETFASVHFVWNSNVDWNYVQAVRPAIVLTEMAERFMNIVPADDLDIESFGAARLRDFLAAQT